MTIPDPDEIQSQVTAVARPCNHEDLTNPAAAFWDGGLSVVQHL